MIQLKLNYTNTNVIIDNLSIEDILNKIELYKWIGYQNLFISFNYDNINKARNIISMIKSKISLNIYGKIQIFTDNLKDLKIKLKNIQEYRDFAISLATKDINSLLFAANDSRIDIISVCNREFLKEITPGVISLVKQQAKTKFIEFSLISALEEDYYNRAQIFRELGIFLKWAIKNENILIYGGSERDPALIRGPKEIIYSIYTIFNIPLNKCKRIFRENSKLLIDKIINRNENSYFTNELKFINKIKNEI